MLETKMEAQQNTSVVSQPKKWYKHKGIVWILFLIFVAACLVSIYFFRNKPQDSESIFINHKIIKIPSDWITYTQPEDGWQISYPSEWQHFSEDVNLNPNYLIITEHFVRSDWTKWDESTGTIPDIKIKVESADLLDAKFSMEEAATNTPGVYPFSLGEFQGSKAYIMNRALNGGTARVIRFEINDKYYEIAFQFPNDNITTQIINTFKPGKISGTELTKINLNDLEKKSDLRSRLPGLLSECLDDNKQIYPTNGQEKITEANQKETILYKTIVGQNCDRFIITPYSPNDYYTYYNDGKNWEASAVLENKNDPECTLIGPDCIYKVRNGAVISQK